MTQAKLDRLKKKMAAQAADLVNKAEIDPLIVHTLLLDLSIAVPISVGYPARLLADSLRLCANRLEESEGLPWRGKIPEA